MNNQQVKNLLEKSLEKSKKATERGGGYDVDKLVTLVEIIIDMLEIDSAKIVSPTRFPYDNS